MPLKSDAVGKEWGPATYQVAREKIAEYAKVLGHENPVHFDRRAAEEAGFPDVVAPPMFVVVYSAAALRSAILDPVLAMNTAGRVHGAQEFAWGEPVCSGDEITTVARCLSIHEKSGLGFYVFETTSRNERGAEVARGVWTNIVRLVI